MAMAFGAVSSGLMLFNEAVPRKLGFPPKMVLMFSLGPIVAGLEGLLPVGSSTSAKRFDEEINHGGNRLSTAKTG